MKKLHLLLLSITLCVFSACHNDIWDAIDGLDSRVTKLEELCKEMNTNITSLQTIVSVLQSNDYITGIVEIKKNGEVIGYTITFGKHDPITIYHGQDGKNGADGKDGITPVIGVAQDTDGVYYWTLNGEWLLDDNGNKLPVSGKDGQNGTNGSNGQDGADGKDGQNGEDGKDGADGQDGKDGITPQLKIEEGYWYISYDNGATWTQLGKATGEDGKDGQNGTDGEDGQDGDSMFQSVTQDENYVYFTLADGTVIKIAKGNGNSQSNDDFIFTITYDSNGGEGVMEKDTFYYGCVNKISSCLFIKDAYTFTTWNTKPDGSGASYSAGINIIIDRDIILYAQWRGYEYVDLGLSVKWATFNVGATKPEEYGEYFAWGSTTPNGNAISTKPLVLPQSADAAYVNWGGSWRMPTKNECEELVNNCLWNKTTLNNVIGYKITGTTGNSIFLPLGGAYTGGSYHHSSYARYWSSTGETWNSSFLAYEMWANSENYKTIDTDNNIEIRKTVRPVCP